VSFETFQDVKQQLEQLVGDLDPGTPRGKTRARLLDAAAEQFVHHGYRKTNIDEIARQAGIGKGTVYLHFATKAEVLLAALAREKLRALELLRAAFCAEVPPRDRLHACVRATLMMVAGSPLIARVVEGDQELTAILADLDPALMTSAIADRDAFFGRLLDDAIAPEVWSDAARRERIVVLELLGHMAPRLRDERLRRGLPIERVVELLADLIVDGVRPA
jgi:AcrR family transcriptional regulator